MELIDLVLDIAALPEAKIPDNVRQVAQASLMDWITCGRAGAGEPLAGKLRGFAASEGGAGTATLFGGGRAPARMAALVNGAISHALDFDDTHFDHVGHLSVGIYPAALAVGEETGAAGQAIADAFALGAEAAIRIGRVLGAGHYNRGFHQTATAGAFGATIAAGRLRGLDRERMRAAIGLCATRASGLKSQFGTMGKPYNAGIAASNGVECSALAAAGFTSADDGLMGDQGFIPTHGEGLSTDAAFEGGIPPESFRLPDNQYKFHACCHGTHAMIEALLPLAAEGLEAGRVRSLTLQTNPRWLRVCDIKRPRTGLEVKFSYAWLAGMVLNGIPTGNDRTYTDDLAGESRLSDFAGKVTVAGDDGLTDLQARCEIVLDNGETLEAVHDLADRLPADVLLSRLRDKARALVPGGAEAIISRVGALADCDAGHLARLLEQAPGSTA
ncbi:MmgE/PrpD family protein [Zhengella sp. ZM62]|uniref:MmgE/PrpD family protein n=1 Tax=Zhengella sedimenti TaxID=3390035 RepID=UPI003975510F